MAIGGDCKGSSGGWCWKLGKRARAEETTIRLSQWKVDSCVLGDHGVIGGDLNRGPLMVSKV